MEFEFDKWFNKQSTLIKVLLLIIPFVGWVVECLVRLSVMLRTKETIHIVAFVVFLLIGGLWIPAIADLVYLVVKGNLFLAE